jgi:hypothetical protein
MSMNDESSGMSSAVASCDGKLRRQGATHLESSQLTRLLYYSRVYSTIVSSLLYQCPVYSLVPSLQSSTHPSTPHTLTPHTPSR